MEVRSPLACVPCYQVKSTHDSPNPILEHLAQNDEFSLAVLHLRSKDSELFFGHRLRGRMRAVATSSEIGSLSGRWGSLSSAWVGW